MPLRRGDEARVGLEFVVAADIDDGGGLGKSDEAGELGYGDFGRKWHGVHLGSEDLDAMFRLTPHGVIAIDPLWVNAQQRRADVNPFGGRDRRNQLWNEALSRRESSAASASSHSRKVLIFGSAAVAFGQTIQ